MKICWMQIIPKPNIWHVCEIRYYLLFCKGDEEKTCLICSLSRTSFLLPMKLAVPSIVFSSLFLHHQNRRWCHKRSSLQRLEVCSQLDYFYSCKFIGRMQQLVSLFFNVLAVILCMLFQFVSLDEFVVIPDHLALPVGISVVLQFNFFFLLMVIITYYHHFCFIGYLAIMLYFNLVRFHLLMLLFLFFVTTVQKVRL